MSVGDLVGIHRRLARDVEDRPDGELRVATEVLADPGFGERPDALDPRDPGALGTAVEVEDVDRDRRKELGPVDVLGAVQELHRRGRVGQDQDRLHAAYVLRVGVAQPAQQIGEEGHRGVEPGDGGEGSADVEAAHPVLVGPGRVGELPTLRGLLRLGRRDRVGGLDGCFHQGLEPCPGDPAVGHLDHSLVDVVGLLPGQVAGLARTPRPAACPHRPGASHARLPGCVPATGRSSGRR